MIAIEGIRRRLKLGPESVIDGDTLRAQDSVADAWGVLLSRLRRHADGSIRLRLAALDAPESDYAAGSSGLRHQAPAQCAAAAEGLRQLLAEAVDGIDLLACGADRYGRALAFLWPAAGPEAGRAQPVESSLNARLLRSGLAFPDFHAGLPAPGLERLAAEVRLARAHALGVWSGDSEQVQLPRLFRRQSDFCRLQGLEHAVFDAGTLVRFREYLEQRERAVLLRDSGRVLPFAECVRWTEDPLSVRGDVENFLYLSANPEIKLT